MKHVPVTNSLMAALPRKDRQHLVANCERVELNFGDVLSEPEERIQQVYFPVGSLISLISAVDDGENLEVDLVGNEGMLGVSLVLGIDVSPLRALVQVAGAALRIGAVSFRRELESSPALRRELNRYIYVLLAQLAKTAACTRFHELDARLARWLLMTHDRTHANEFHLTHETLARMLGVRRVGVTKGAGLLQKHKLISYRRGDIKILDRTGLEAVSCGCYRAVKDTQKHILG